MTLQDKIGVLSSVSVPINRRVCFESLPFERFIDFCQSLRVSLCAKFLKKLVLAEEKLNALVIFSCLILLILVKYSYDILY